MAAIGTPSIHSLLDLGADAMDNLYDICITLPEEIQEFSITRGHEKGIDAEGLMHKISLRIEGFDPPIFTQGTQSFKYKNITGERPTPTIVGNRSFKINIRLDANYHSYLVLKKWKEMNCHASIGLATSGVNKKSLGMVEVYALRGPVFQEKDATWRDNQGVSTEAITSVMKRSSRTPERMIWRYRQAWVSELTEPSFKRDNGNIQIISATFRFGEFESSSTSMLLGFDMNKWTSIDGTI